MSDRPVSPFIRWRITTGILLIVLSGWGIYSVRQYLNTLSLETLGSLISVSGEVSSIEGKDKTLKLSLGEEAYISSGPFPKEFHRGKLVTSEITPGDQVQLLIAEVDDGGRIDFYGLSSGGVEWLSPEGLK